MRASSITLISATFSLATTALLTPSLPKLNFKSLLDFARKPALCTSLIPQSANSSAQLQIWSDCQIKRFYAYPENGAWDAAFAQAFHGSLKASFNGTQYDYDGWLSLYHAHNESIGQIFDQYLYGFTSSVAVPNHSDKGGFVHLTGWAGGLLSDQKVHVWATNAAFAHVVEVDGERKIFEFIESSNLPEVLSHILPSDHSPLPNENDSTGEIQSEQGSSTVSTSVIKFWNPSW